MKNPDGKLARWAIALQSYDLSIHHRSGKENANADALSRRPYTADSLDQQPSAACHICNQLLEQSKSATALDCEQAVPEIYQIDNTSRALAKAQREAQQLRELIGSLQGETGNDTCNALINRKAEFQITNELLYRVAGHKSTTRDRPNLQLVLPQAFREEALTACHDHLLGGHLGIRKTADKLTARFWWPNCLKDVKAWCASCETCASRKGLQRKIRPPLQSIPATAPCHKVACDIVGPLPLSREGNKYIIVFMDYFTKWPECFALPDTKSARLARIIVEQVICRFGVPRELLTDQGKNFVSELMQEVCQLLNVKKLQTTAYYSQCDGMVERFNRTLENMLSAYVNTGQDDWDALLPYVLFAYRSSVHESPNETPFFLNMGRDPALPLLMPQSETDNESTNTDDYRYELARKLNTAWDVAENEIRSGQAHQKRYYDQKSARHTFLPGDRIYLYCPIAKKGKSPKFHRPWKGPYRILTVTDDGTGATIVPCVQPNRKAPVRVNVQRLKFAPRAPGPPSREPPRTSAGGVTEELTDITDNQVGADVLHEVAEEDAPASAEPATNAAPINDTAKGQPTKACAPSATQQRCQLNPLSNAPSQQRYNLRNRTTTTTTTVCVIVKDTDNQGDSEDENTTSCDASEDDTASTASANSDSGSDCADLIVIDEWFPSDDDANTTVTPSEHTGTNRQGIPSNKWPSDTSSKGGGNNEPEKEPSRQSSTLNVNMIRGGKTPTTTPVRFKVSLRSHLEVARRIKPPRSHFGYPTQGIGNPLVIISDSGHPFSPDFPTHFQIGYETFTTADQCLRYYECLETGRFRTAARLTFEMPGFSQDRLESADDEEEDPSATADVIGIMRMANFQKFSQNPMMASILAATGEATLIYASTDAFWGVGVTETDARAHDPPTHYGGNQLGKILEDIRTQMGCFDQQQQISTIAADVCAPLYGQYSVSKQTPNHLNRYAPSPPAGTQRPGSWDYFPLFYTCGIPTVRLLGGNALVVAWIKTNTPCSTAKTSLLNQQRGALAANGASSVDTDGSHEDHTESTYASIVNLELIMGSTKRTHQFLVTDSQDAPELVLQMLDVR